MVDLEIGEAMEWPEDAWCYYVDVRTGEPVSRHTKFWHMVSLISNVSTFVLSYNLLIDINKFYMFLAQLSFLLVHASLIIYLWKGLVHLPRVLERSEKQLFESAFVFVCASWTYYDRDGDILKAALVLDIFFKVFPLMNLGLYFENFSLWDCCLVVLIDAALLYVRNCGVVVFMGVAAACVALQLIKDPFRQYCSIKFKGSAEEKLVI